MHPAIEIDLHLERIYAARRQSPSVLEAASRVSMKGTNLLPLAKGRAKKAGYGLAIAGTADGCRRCR
jgi:hypothetical protein